MMHFPYKTVCTNRYVFLLCDVKVLYSKLLPLIAGSCAFTITHKHADANMTENCMTSQT